MESSQLGGKINCLASPSKRSVTGPLPATHGRLQETKAIATRSHSEIVLNAVAGALPEIIGGSADLTPSNLTALKVSSLRPPS
jgi:transketolase